MCYKRLVLSSGGLNGLVYIGILQFFEENKSKFSTITEIIGTSAGAFVALLIILNYTSKELKKEFYNFDFSKAKDFKISNLLTNYALDNGQGIENTIKSFIIKKGLDPEISFKELQAITNKKLIVTGSNVNRKTFKFFDVDKDPDTPVYLAVKISMSIPLIFSPVLYKGDYYVDGAMGCDLPVEYPNPENSKTLCINLSKKSLHDEINSIESYISNIVRISFNCANNQSLIYLRKKGMDLIEITGGIKLDLDLNVNKEQIDDLVKLGYESAKNQLNLNIG